MSQRPRPKKLAEAVVSPSQPCGELARNINSIITILVIMYRMKGLLTHLRKKFTSTAPPVASALPPKSNGNNVLVVDDDNEVCQIIQRMLSYEKYQVQTSQCVADALRAVRRTVESRDNGFSQFLWSRSLGHGIKTVAEDFRFAPRIQVRSAEQYLPRCFLDHLHEH